MKIESTQFNYLKYTRDNTVPMEVIDSLGGLKDTIQVMKESLLKYELRPLDYVPNYQNQI
jgi:hypothetical protein